MAVHFECAQPSMLLQEFDAQIKRREQLGKITTWECTEDGKFYTHRAAEWNRKAWFRAEVQPGRLTFFVVKSSSVDVTTTAYAYYHGHLIETFLSHFDQWFSKATASSLPEERDVVQ